MVHEAYAGATSSASSTRKAGSSDGRSQGSHLSWTSQPTVASQPASTTATTRRGGIGHRGKMWRDGWGDTPDDNRTGRPAATVGLDRPGRPPHNTPAQPGPGAP